MGERVRGMRAADARLAAPFRAFAMIAALSLLAFGLSACGSSGSSHSSGTITLYSGQHPQTTDALVADFERTTGIHVAIRSNDENALVDEIVAEGRRSPADVIYTENTPALEYLAGKALLATIPASVTKTTSPRYDSNANEWVGVSARLSAIVYNPSLISASELPTSVLQLAAKRFKNKIAIAPGETDFQPIVTSVLHSYGRSKTISWLEGLKANGQSHDYSSNEKVVAEVNSGAVAFGVIEQYYWYRLRAQIGTANMRSRLAYFAAGDPGFVLGVSGAAVLATSSHKGAAERFVAYLVSRAGQEMLAHSTSFEYPVAAGVVTAQPLPDLASLHPNSITLSELSNGQQALSLLREVQLL